jgi:hydrogenase expression/formation protein HypD
LLEEVFEVVDRPWRGFAPIRCGGLALRHPYRHLDAFLRFALPDPDAAEVAGGTAVSPGGTSADTAAPPAALRLEPSPRREDSCIAALVLQGRRRPDQCPAFGGACTPEHPLGAPMVSSEGACAAYHRYRPRG